MRLKHLSAAAAVVWFGSLSALAAPPPSEPESGSGVATSIGVHGGLNVPQGYQYQNYTYSAGGGLEVLFGVPGLQEHDVQLRLGLNYIGYEYRRDPRVSLRMSQVLAGVEVLPVSSRFFIKPLFGADVGFGVNWLTFGNAANSVPNFGTAFVTQARMGFMCELSSSFLIGAIAPVNIAFSSQTLISLGAHAAVRIKL